jgi:hypothetical protein
MNKNIYVAPVDAGIWARAETAAHGEGVSLSALVTRALKREIERTAADELAQHVVALNFRRGGVREHFICLGYQVEGELRKWQAEGWELVAFQDGEGPRWEKPW